MLLDRALTCAQLDLALRVGQDDPQMETNRKRLTLALRDLVSDQEAQGKTKKCLTRVWLNPPEGAAQMIVWARTGDWPPETVRFVHFGALLATFPFVGVVARIVGQRLNLDGRAFAPDVRADVRRRVGDRSAVDVAARKAYTTFANLGLIAKVGQTIQPAETLSNVPAVLGAWAAHALMLTRQADAVPITSLASAPEMLGWRIGPLVMPNYPLLTRHATADGPVLAVAR